MKYFLFLLMFLVVGCSSNVDKSLMAIDGSKADAVVSLYYEIEDDQTPVIDWDLALKTAKEKCENWKFTDASKFGGEKKECSIDNKFGQCDKKDIYVKYQCIE